MDQIPPINTYSCKTLITKILTRHFPYDSLNRGILSPKTIPSQDSSSECSIDLPPKVLPHPVRALESLVLPRTRYQNMELRPTSFAYCCKVQGQPPLHDSQLRHIHVDELHVRQIPPCIARCYHLLIIAVKLTHTYGFVDQQFGLFPIWSCSGNAQPRPRKEVRARTPETRKSYNNTTREQSLAA